MIFQFSKSSGGSGKDPAEEELKKRRKRKIDKPAGRGSASNKNKPATDNHTMIITFATQKGSGKTTLALAFANYLTIVSERKINVFDFDYQKSFFNKWKEDESLELPKLYDVEVIGNDDEEQPFADLEKLLI